MALDEPKDTDEVFKEGDFTFCIEKDLLATVESIKIGMSYMGFQVDSGKPLPGGASAAGCAGCGGSCSTE